MKIAVNVEQGSYNDDTSTERTFRTAHPTTTNALEHRTDVILKVGAAVKAALEQTDINLGPITRLFATVSYEKA